VWLQITEALTFLHYSGHVLHRNVCPASILVTKKGTWKLGGLEFTGQLGKLSELVPGKSGARTNPSAGVLCPAIQRKHLRAALNASASAGTAKTHV